MNNKKCQECLGPFKSRFCKKFCSLECSKIYNLKKYNTVQVFCLNCKKRIQNRLHQTYCSYSCRIEHIINLFNDNKYNSTTKGGSISTIIRDYLLKINNYKCSICGWSGINPISKKTTLHIDHSDGNRKNGFIGNLKVLCPNCHSLTPTWGALNIKNKNGDSSVIG